MAKLRPTAKVPVLLAGGNPQIAKADGDAAIQAYIAATTGWKRDLVRSLDGGSAWRESSDRLLLPVVWGGISSGACAPEGDGCENLRRRRRAGRIKSRLNNGLRKLYLTMKTSSSPGMKRGRLPWLTKLRPEMQPMIIPDLRGRGQMLLPTPMLVAEEMATIPKGSLLSFPMLRTRLARRFHADLTCPLMTGIFFNIVAGAAEEQLAAGAEPLSPYWRVVIENGTLSPKTPAGAERQAEHLRCEGHEIQLHRDKLRVIDYRKNLLM